MQAYFVGYFPFKSNASFSQVFKHHFEAGAKPETILVITDGSPDDGQAVEREIIECTKRLRDDDEMSISFIQIGEDPGAKKYLKNLDNALESKGAKFDIGIPCGFAVTSHYLKSTQKQANK